MRDLKSLKLHAKGLSVLYVEDNHALRENVATLLLRLFDRVDSASDGQEGLEKFNAHHYSIVITDIKMPHMDGMKLSQKILQMNVGTKVILMSAFDDKEYLFEAIELGVFRFLKKPVSLNDLTQVLHQAVSQLKNMHNEEDTDSVDDSNRLQNELKIIKNSNEKLEVHNYYKGLSITNDAKILNIGRDTLEIQTNYIQEKAIQYEGKTFIASENLSYDIKCDTVHKIMFEQHSVELQDFKFVKDSPISRQTIRLEPEEEHTVDLFISENKFYGKIRIEDISLDAIRLKLNALPAGLEKDFEIRVDIVFNVNKRPINISTSLRLLKKVELDNSFDLVFIFKGNKKSELVKYITKRQMAIIREFKGMQNG